MPKFLVTLSVPTYQVYEIEIDADDAALAEELVWENPDDYNMIGEYEAPYDVTVDKSERVT